MDAQRPHGPVDLWCPLWRKRMSDVCHTCPLWVRLIQVNPQTGENVDRWDCAFAANVMVGVEQAQRTHQMAATMDDARNTIADAITDASSRRVIQQ